MVAVLGLMRPRASRLPWILPPEPGPIRERDRVIHSCNYIAGDMVFTKNGGSVGRLGTG